MSNFKPMVKMMTDEPSVSLKLKKGGKVKAKKHHKEHEEHGHKAMAHHAMGGMHHAFESEAGKAPKKPSMMARMKAMNPMQYAKGGKVAHKVMGGGMPMGNQTMPMMKPMGASALAGMNPKMRNARAMAVRKAITGMKKGGSADHKEIEKLEKELHHHESLDMKHAHPEHKAHGGHMKHHAHGGKVHKISGHPEGTHEHHKAMAKHHKKMCDETGSAHHARKCEEHKHMAKMCKGGSYASGGEIDSDETRTTVKGNAKKFVSMIHDGEHADHTSGRTGDVKLGNGGGYKHGGKAHKKHHYAEGGTTGNTIPSDSKKNKNTGKTVLGGTLEGNEHDYVDTDMHTADKFSGSKSTGGVRMSNAGGYKRGGRMHHKASGGAIDKYDVRDTVEGGNWENRPADTTPKGKTNTKTGEVKLANAGGYKHGGHTAKKHYATGGNVNDMGKAVKMPKHFVSRPVANSLQSGTFKRGGKVRHHAEGDSVVDDAGTRATNKAYKNWEQNQREENEADANLIPNMVKRAGKAIKGMFGSSPESVTKTEKSITVTPAKRRGGSMR